MIPSALPPKTEHIPVPQSLIPTALNIAQELSGMGWEELGVRGVSIEWCLGYLG